MPLHVFQSSPTSKGGRYRDSRDAVEVTAMNRFQSSPTSKGGRYHRSGRAGRNFMFQAHLERWALRFDSMYPVMLYEFQSSPTSKGGRYHGLTGPCSGHTSTRVSILAHLERWALPYLENLPNFQTVNISIRRTSCSYRIILIRFVQPHAQTPCEISLFCTREPPGNLQVLPVRAYSTSGPSKSTEVSTP